MKNSFYQERLKYQPSLPAILQDIRHIEAQSLNSMQIVPEIQKLFPKSGIQPMLHFKRSFQEKKEPLRVGVVFSGGQAAGGHNVIVGLFDALTQINPSSRLFGFLGGPSGLIDNEYQELTQDRLNPFRNSGGFDLLGSGRTKIEKAEQLAAVRAHCTHLKLDGLVIIGGDDSNTNAAFLAEYFKEHQLSIHVIGVPKTIDGDLKNEFIECSFGFDTACKVYSEMIGNICRDAISAKKYTHFIKLMGRSASHVALECALQTHPNCTLIGEEIALKKMTLKHVVDFVCGIMMTRAEHKKNYGVVLIPEGLIEFIYEMKLLIKEINTLLGHRPDDLISHLSKEARLTFTYLPKEIGEQLLYDRDPHGNIQVSHIATEQLLIKMIQKELSVRGFKGDFSPVGHFFGYEGRCGYPSNFDVNYCYALGYTAAALIQSRMSGYMSGLQKLSEPVAHWEPTGIPFTSMMGIEERKGEKKAVIQKALVDIQANPFKFFESQRQKWSLGDHYLFPGPIQYFGPSSICDSRTLTLSLESQKIKF